MKRVLKIVTIVFAALMFLASCSSGTKETTTAAEPATVSQTELRQKYIEEIRPVLEKNYKDHYEIVENESDIYINIWGDGVAQDATTIKNNPTDENMKVWETTKTNMGGLSAEFQKRADSIGYTEDIYFNLLNDLSKDKSLLTYYHGACLFDAMGN